jgi:uncharacterized alkaline shock family protein YloU
MKKFRELIEGFTSNAEDEIKKILNDEMKVTIKPNVVYGYSKYSELELNEPAVKQTNKGFDIFVEYQVKDKAEAKKITTKLKKRLENLLGVKVPISVEKNIWGTDKGDDETWYVVIDTSVKVPV